jgi:hypothetical protein
MFKNAVAQLECRYESLGSYGPEYRILYCLAVNYGMVSWQNTFIMRMQRARGQGQQGVTTDPQQTTQTPQPNAQTPQPQFINGGPGGSQQA